MHRPSVPRLLRHSGALALLLGLAGGGVALTQHTAASPHGAHAAHASSHDLEAMHEHLMQLLGHLEITETQRAALEDVHERHAESVVELHEQLEAARGAVWHQVHTAGFDEGAIRQAAAQVAPLEEDLFVLHGELMGELRNVLTEEQQTAFEQMHALHSSHPARSSESGLMSHLHELFQRLHGSGSDHP